ncbi:hypothetical protein BH11ACT3_BH11ACT3_23810 [soil metagenome]
MLSAAESTRWAGLDPRAAASFLSGRSLLRHLAADLLGVDPAAVPLTARCLDCGREHGRPSIVDSALQVSLSHSGDVVVAAAVWGSPIGVDVEAAAGSTERLDAIEALTGERSLERWTRVESVLKADGRGLRVDPRDVVMTGDVAHVVGSSTRYRLHELTISGVVASVATGF